MLRRAVLLLLVGAQLALPAAAKKPKKLKVEEATNFQLGLEYSHWLVGPTSLLASETEQIAYLKLTSDAEAESFIRTFWEARDPEPEMFGNAFRQDFDTRAIEADKRYREGASVGSRTARGVVFVVYGEPEEVIYETSTKLGEPNLEVWIYAKDAVSGLDGRQPKQRYWFAEKDGKMVEHTPRASRRNTIRQ
jgi:GWxTD domain-containing protein